MNIQIKQIERWSIAEIVGEIDGATAPLVQDKVLPLASPGAQVILDMSGVPFMSSAGLRMLLVLSRKISQGGGKVALVGLSSDLKDTMELTGFLALFMHYESLTTALAAQGALVPA
jgi:anti-sigma B factor antagonist